MKIIEAHQLFPFIWRRGKSNYSKKVLNLCNFYEEGKIKAQFVQEKNIESMHR